MQHKTASRNLTPYSCDQEFLRACLETCVEHEGVGSMEQHHLSGDGAESLLLEESAEAVLWLMKTQVYLTERIESMVSFESTPPQTRQLDFITRYSKRYVDGFVGELTLERPLE